MASIKSKAVRWRDPVSGKQFYRKFKTPAEAEVFANRKDLEKAQYRDGYLEAEQIEKREQRIKPIGQLIREYAEDLNEREISDGHKRDLLGNLDRLLKWGRIKDVRDLTKQRTKQMLRRVLDRGCCNRTFNAYRSALVEFCDWCVTWEHLTANPVVVDVRDQSERTRPSRGLTVRELDSLIQNCIDPRRQALYLLRARTGLRCKEATRITWDDIDLEARTLTLSGKQTKNKKSDLVPLTADVRSLLNQLAQEPIKFGQPVDKRPFPTMPDCRTWKRDLDRAGITYQTKAGQADPKCLRKTFDHLLMQADVDPFTVTLCMRQKLPAGTELAVRVYGDPKKVLDYKRHAVGQMMTHIRKQRRAKSA